MEEKKKNGSGIFLGVVAVATLIVAIIGATFAYFSISLTSAEDAVNVTAYEYAVTLSMSRVYPAAGSNEELIPLDPDGDVDGATGTYTKNLLYALNVASDRCVDVPGNNQPGHMVCALYKLEFENTSASAITFNGVVHTVSNTASATRSGATPFVNLTLQELTGDINSLELPQGIGPVNIVATAAPASSSEGEQPTNTDISIGTVTVPANSTAEGNGVYEKYLVIYLNDEGEDQSNEMGASYTGQLIYSSTGNSSRLTGTFSL